LIGFHWSPGVFPGIVGNRDVVLEETVDENTRQH